MNKIKYFSLVIISALFLTSCVDVSTSEGLVINSSNFNKINSSGEFESVPDKIFTKGETVYLMLFDVEGFEKGDDGLNHVEMDMKILDSRDSVIFEQVNLLGENGDLDLEDNIATNPQTHFTPTTDIYYGNFQFYIKIYDEVSGKSATINKGFSYN